MEKKSSDLKSVELIQISSDEKYVNIKLPIDLLIHCAKHHPDGEIKVIDRNGFAKEIVNELSDTVGESGLTPIQSILDDCFLRIAESGSECIDNN